MNEVYYDQCHFNSYSCRYSMKTRDMLDVRGRILPTKCGDFTMHLVMDFLG